jgi:AGCS family alanine or glycine:cation symporter
MAESNSFMSSIDALMIIFVDFMWGTPLVVLLLGGGLFFTIYSRFTPYRYLKHAVQIVMGKYDESDDPGQINHFQALSSALASTVGMGNISGVAIAIHTGGPGAVFWMWMSAIVGAATKFFTCSLSIMYRGKDDNGETQGGPMYVIHEALNSKFRFLAVLFSVAGLFGCLALFQVNQLTQIVRDEIFIPNGMFVDSAMTGNLIFGIFVAILVAMVIFGGIRRIGIVASRMVPAMVILYLFAGLLVIFQHFWAIPSLIKLIVVDAFTGDALLGGAVGTVILMGVRRAAFSNEAGIGTEAMAHGAAKTQEPIREGLVAMLGPFIDTIVVCSITALVILATGVWQSSEANGVTLTAQAFTLALPGMGRFLLLASVGVFSISTMIGYSYYGAKCTSYLFGTKWKKHYRVFYVITLVIGAAISIDAVINFLDGMFALMAIPTMVSSLILAPKVMKASKKYFSSLEKEKDIDIYPK